jgi:hypothetical protein
MRIVYLDQNKWIELARAAKSPAEHPENHALLQEIADAVAGGRLMLPLAATDIYETHKINDRERRSELASFQALFSGGVVFRGRHKRLEVEISALLRSIYNLPDAPEEPNWFLSKVFFEAFLESDDERFAAPLSDHLLNLLRARSDFCLYDYLINCPEAVRLGAVKRFSAGSEKLRQRVEKRRAQHSNESESMRRKLYSALLMIDEIELILTIAQRAGVAWSSTSDMDASNARRIITDVPTYYVEREIALRLEAQDRALHENDFRDMQSFCAVLPYADQVIGENQFVNLALQAGLNKKYRTELATNILALRKYL